MSLTSDISGTEFIYWPLGVKVAIWMFIFVAVLFFGWFIFWQETINTYNRLVDTENDLKRTLTEKIKASRGKKELEAKIPKINDDFGELLKLLPSDASVDNLIFDLNQVGASKGISVDSITGMNEKRTAYFVMVPVKVSFKSTYTELGRFVEDLSRLPRLVTMDEFNIKRVSDDPAKPELQIQAIATTFRNTDKK